MLTEFWSKPRLSRGLRWEGYMKMVHKAAVTENVK